MADISKITLKSDKTYAIAPTLPTFLANSISADDELDRLASLQVTKQLSYVKDSVSHPYPKTLTVNNTVTYADDTTHTINLSIPTKVADLEDGTSYQTTEQSDARYIIKNNYKEGDTVPGNINFTGTLTIGTSDGACGLHLQDFKGSLEVTTYLLLHKISDGTSTYKHRFYLPYAKVYEGKDYTLATTDDIPVTQDTYDSASSLPVSGIGVSQALATLSTVASSGKFDDLVNNSVTIQTSDTSTTTDISQSDLTSFKYVKSYTTDTFGRIASIEFETFNISNTKTALATKVNVTNPTTEGNLVHSGLVNLGSNDVENNTAYLLGLGLVPVISQGLVLGKYNESDKSGDIVFGCGTAEQSKTSMTISGSSVDVYTNINLHKVNLNIDGDDNYIKGNLVANNRDTGLSGCIWVG